MLALVGLGGYVLLSQSGTPVVYEKTNEPANEPAVETPAWMQDADAIAAAEAVVKRKALEAERAELEARQAELETRISEIEKELGF